MKSATVRQSHDIQLVTMRIHNQLLSIPVSETREILHEQKITKVPLVDNGIAGTLNLRGRIVTVLDIRHRLQLPLHQAGAHASFVVVEYKGELYSLIVDSVGDVLTVPSSDIQDAPPNLDANWRSISSGIYKLDTELLVVLDPKALFSFASA